MVNRWKREFSDNANGLKTVQKLSEEQKELAKLRKELREVTMERDILKKAVGIFFQERQVRYEFITTHRGEYPVEKLCMCMRVSKSSYYHWLKTKDTKKQKPSLVYLKKRINILFDDNKQIYGSKRIKKALQREGLHCSVSYISSLMRLLGLKSVLKKKYIALLILNMI